MVYVLAVLTVLFFSGVMMYVLNQTVNRYKPKRKAIVSTSSYRPVPVHQRGNL